MRAQLHWVDCDGTGGHHRPYLIVQAEALNLSAPTIIALPITISPQRAGYPLTIELPAAVTGFGRNAWIRATQPETLRRSLIGEYITTLPDSHYRQVLDALTTILDLEPNLNRATGAHEGSVGVETSVI